MSIANNTIVIAALSSRIYAEAAAKAGLNVIAIDAFADIDLANCAQQHYRVNADDNQLDIDALITVLNQLDKHSLLGFCYGAGLEATPEALQQIAQIFTILGNAGSVVMQCKQPVDFFGLCEALHIPYPEISYQQPMNPSGWLQKSIGGSGGTHVVPLEYAPITGAAHIYYQRLQSGNAISCLFVANNGAVEVIGFNLLWADKASNNAYRYGGAMSHAEISDDAKQTFIQYLKQLVLALGLQGVNSCDAICDGDEVYIIELNPRLSASMDLYPDDFVMQKHIAACLQADMASHYVQKTMTDGERLPVKKAHQIIYATQPIILENEIAWPSWVHDVPSAGQQFDIGMPICTVSMQANKVQQVQAGLMARVAWVERQLLN